MALPPTMAVSDAAPSPAPATPPRPRMKFASQAAISLTTQVATQALSFGTALVMPKILAPEVKGPCDLVMGISLPLIVWSNLGLATALLYHPDRHKIPFERLVSTVITTAVCVGLVAAGIAALALPGYFSAHHGAVIQPWHVALVLATTPLQLSTSYLNSTQLLAGRVIGFNVIQFLPTFLYISVFFALYLGMGSERFRQNPELFLTSMVIARITQWALTASVSAWLLRDIASFRPAIDWGFLKKALAFGFRPYLSNCFQVCTLNFALYFVDAVGMPAEQIGFFSLSVIGMTALWSIPEAVQMVLANRLSSMTPQERSWFTPIACRTILAITAFSAVGIALASELFFRYWAPNYRPALASLRILLVGSVLFTFFKVLQSDFLARGRVNVVPMLSGTTFAVLTALSVGILGIGGVRTIEMAATCTSAAMGLTGLLALFLYSRISRNPVHLVAFPQWEDVKLWREFAGRLRKKTP